MSADPLSYTTTITHIPTSRGDDEYTISCVELYKSILQQHSSIEVFSGSFTTCRVTEARKVEGDDTVIVGV